MKTGTQVAYERSCSCAAPATDQSRRTNEGVALLISNAMALVPPRNSTRPRFTLASGLLCVVVAALTACSPGGATTAQDGTPPPKAAQSPVTTKADTSLCNLISTQEFYSVVKAPVGSLHADIGTVSGFQEVNCTYKPPSLPGAGGAITYLFTNDGAAYFAKVQLGDQSVYNSETVVSGIGDAAFWGTQQGAPDAFELNMRKGNVVINILMDGSASDGSAYLSGAEQIAQEIAAHL
jgi:hypothetical protein